MNHCTFGTTTIARVKDASDLGAIFNDPLLQTSPVIIKPNWVSEDPGDFTDAKALRTLFEALNTRIILIESHMILRHGAGMRFVVNGQEVDWRWLLKGDGWNWLVENPGWEWFKDEGHWSYIQEAEQRFLERNGFSDLLEEFDATYINVTDELWNGRTADPQKVKQTVESRFQPLHDEAFYHMIPQKVYDLRGSTFISLAKFKMYASFTFKNLFGLIPDPCRPYWHGREGSKIAGSIIDINKVYHSLFNMFGICEALSVTGVSDPQGAHQGVYSGKYTLVDAPGLVAAGSNLVSLDAMLLELTKDTIRSVPPLNQAPIDLAGDEFGPIDKTAVTQAKNQVGEWFKFQVQPSAQP